MHIGLDIAKSNSIALLRSQGALVSELNVSTGIVPGLLAQFSLDSPLVFQNVIRDHESVSVNSSIGVTISGTNNFSRVFITAMCCLLFAFARWLQFQVRRKSHL